MSARLELPTHVGNTVPMSGFTWPDRAAGTSRTGVSLPAPWTESPARKPGGRPALCPGWTRGQGTRASAFLGDPTDHRGGSG